MGAIEEGNKSQRKKYNLPDRNRNAPLNSTPTSRNSSIHRHEQQRQSSQNAEKDTAQHVVNVMSDQQTRDGSCRCVKGPVVLLWILCVLSLGLSGLCGLRIFHVEERLTSLETKYRQLEMQHQEQQEQFLPQASRRKRNIQPFLYITRIAKWDSENYLDKKKHPRTNMVSVKCICPTSEPESKADRRRRETEAKSGSVNPKIKLLGFGPVRSVDLPEFDSQNRKSAGLQKRDRHRRILGRGHPVSGPQGDVVLPEDEEDIRTSIRR